MSRGGLDASYIVAIVACAKPLLEKISGHFRPASSFELTGDQSARESDGLAEGVALSSE